jgi:hypothetical protein
MRGLIRSRGKRGRVSRHVVVACASAALAPWASAQVDNLQTVVGRTNAVGTGSTTNLSGYVYDGATDTAYTASSGAGQGLRRITSVSTGSPLSEVLVSESQWQYWFRGGTTLRSGQPAVQGLVFNPARTGLYLTDQSPVTNTAASDGNTLRNNPVNKVAYAWNLGAALPANDVTAAGNVLSPVMTRAEYATAAGLASPNTTTTNPLVSQPALAGDGSLYMLDGSTGYGGIWKLSTTGGTPQRIVGAGFSKTEIAARQLSATADRIFLPQSNTTATPGIGYVDHDHQGGTTSAYTQLLSGADINAFLGGPSDVEYSINAIANDAAGNFYFDVSGGNVLAGTRRAAVLRLDPQGRLVKTLGYGEKRTFFGSATTTTTKLQFRTATFNGPGGAVSMPQLLFADTASSGAYVGGAWLFEPGDFDRDGARDADDASLFAGALHPVGQTTDQTPRFKFDLNGATNTDTASNATQQLVSVDHFDVKVFQDFYGFADGDADFDLALDFDDLTTLSAHYLQDVDKVWTSGDFTGDNRATFADLTLLADTWLDVLNQPRPTEQQLSVYAEPFRTDAMTAFGVPEPSSAAVLSGIAGVGLLGRRRRRR